MKTHFAVLLLLLVATTGSSQTGNFTTLPCGAWGTPDWATLRKEDSKQKARLGARYQKGDENIRLIENGMVYHVYNDPIEIHWLIEDTTIFYSIQLTDLFGEVVYKELTSNDCGVRLHLQELLEETRDDKLYLQVERHAGNEPNYRMFLGIGQFDPAGLNNVDSLIRTEVVDEEHPSSYIKKASALASLKLYFDALTVLAEGVSKGLDKDLASEKYWEIVYDMYTISYHHVNNQR